MVIGGADLDPRHLRPGALEHTEATYRERDEFELALTREAIRRGLPYLGICRGMQLFNVALGGTLDQHLVGDDGVPSHRRIIGRSRAPSTRSTSRRAHSPNETLGGPVHEARCHHHQAVDRLGEGLMASGRARDGVIEAIEPPGPGWALGVQWHPEAGERRELFEAFAEAARASGAPQPPRATGSPRCLVLLRVPQHSQCVWLAGQLDRLHGVAGPADRDQALAQLVDPLVV